MVASIVVSSEALTNTVSVRRCSVFWLVKWEKEFKPKPSVADCFAFEIDYSVYELENLGNLA